MKRRLSLILLALVILALLIPSLLVGSDRADRRLYVVSPHWEGIKYEFEHGFRDWYRKRTGTVVDVVWLDIGGTSRVKHYLEGEVSRAADANDSVDIDVVFGGGDFMHRNLAKARATLRDGTKVPILNRVDLPPEIAADLPTDFGGIHLRDPDGVWLGAALATFGVVYNKDILRRKGLPEPREWADLADPRLYSWVAAADMQMSGTAHAMCEIILQAYGWQRGFAILTKVMGNARYVAQASSDVPEDIARGDVAYGLAIDFYALRQISLHGPHRLGFVAPQNLTVVNADPIAKVNRCANPDLADAFIIYVLSEEGQRLWCYRKGVSGGPRRFELGRLPVRRGLYAAPPDVAEFAFNPFEWQPAFTHDGGKAGKRWDVIDLYLGAALVANHDRLAAAWKAVIDAGLPDDLVRQLCDPIVTEAELMALIADRKAWKRNQYAQRTTWVRQFRDKYIRVRREARARRRT